jgi:ABC-type branched-chain amino acid transport system, permease component
VFRYRLLAFALAGGIAGLSGALAANLYEFSGPGLMHWSRSGEMLVMLILGGMGSLFGGVAGAIMFIGLEEILAGWTEYWAIILGPILILVVLFARGGLMGLVSRGRS